MSIKQASAKPVPASYSEAFETSIAVRLQSLFGIHTLLAKSLEKLRLDMDYMQS